MSVSGGHSTGLQRFGLDGFAVHEKGGGVALYAEGHLVPARVHQSFHSLSGEKATRGVASWDGGPGPQGQGAVGAAEVHRQLFGGM